MHLKSKLGSFEMNKLKCDKMAGHIKVSHRHDDYRGFLATCVFTLFLKGVFSSVPGSADRKNNQRGVSETSQVPESRGDCED